MNHSRMVFSMLFSIALVFSVSVTGSAEPVLIKLNLREPADWANAQSLGVTAFHRFDGFVLAELERTKLAELNGVGLKYQIVDEDPWSQEYLLISTVREPPP